MEGNLELNIAVHISCMSSGYCEREPGTVLVLYCILVLHWTGVGVILFSRIIEYP